MRATDSEEKEAVEVVYETDSLRAVVGARSSEDDKPSLFIEVSVHLFRERQATDIDLLRKQLLLVDQLQALGFSSFHDGAAVIAEVATTGEGIVDDLDRIGRAIASSFG